MTRAWTTGMALVFAALLAGACSGSGPSDASASADRSVAPSAGPTEASDTPGPTAESAPPEDGLPTAPPAATLTVDGGDPVAGDLGSYTWRDGGSNAPWLPGEPIAVGAGETLTLALDPPVGIASWRARYAQFEPGVTPDAFLALGKGDGPPSLSPPRAGSWTVALDLRFEGDLGSAVYFWQVDVQ